MKVLGASAALAVLYEGDGACNAVFLRRDAVARYFEALAMTTYKLHGRDGAAICEIIEEAQ